MLLNQTGQMNKHWKGTAKVTEKPCVSFLSDFSLCVCVFSCSFGLCSAAETPKGKKPLPKVQIGEAVKHLNITTVS